MTVLLDLPAHVAGRVEADARAQNLSVSDLLRDAVIGLYDDEADEWPADIYLTHPLPASLTQPLGEMLRKSQEAAEAGDTVDGDTFLAEMRRLSGRT